MALHVSQHFQLVGSSSSRTSSQTIFSADGNFFVALSLTGEQPREQLSVLYEKIQNVQISSTASFYSFFQRILEQLTQYEVECSCAWVSDNHVVLGAWNADVYLYRNARMGKVLQAGLELKIVEGELFEDDVYVCMTRSAFSVLFESISSSISQDLAGQMPQLVSLLQQSALADRSAVLFLSISNKQTDAPDQESKNDQRHFLQKKKPSLLVWLTNFSKIILRWIKAQFRLHPRFRYGFLVFAFLILLFLLVIGWGKFRLHRDLQTATAFLVPFQEQLAQIQALENSDQIQARDQANSLLVELQSQRSQFDQTRVQQYIDQFEIQLKEYYKSVSGKVELITLPIFYDFRLIQSDFINTSADIDGDYAVFADKEKKTVILVNILTKEQKQLPLGDYPEIYDIAFDQEKVWILGDGVYEYQIESEQSPVKKISADDQINNSSELGVFDQSVYIFSAEDRNIYRYSKGENEEYGQGSSWIQDKLGIDFSLISSMTIDGAIWLSFQDGKILKFERGGQANFEINGLQTPFLNPVYLFTKPDFQNIYVLEPGAQRVVVVTKEGNFIKEVVSPSLASATSLIVREETKTGYVLAGSVVYEVGLE